LWQEVGEYEEKKAAAESRGEKLPTGEEVNHKIPFHSVLLSFLGESLVDDFFSPAIQANSCCGSESVGSICFWAFLPDPDPLVRDPDPSIIKQK
jgi:hypothetical protein